MPLVMINGPAINTGSDDSFPSLSCDGTALFFASNRPGGVGGEDIYVTTRQSLEAVTSAPTLLSLSGDGRGQGAILHPGTSQVASSTNPAVIGEAWKSIAPGWSTEALFLPRYTSAAGSPRSCSSAGPRDFLG